MVWFACWHILPSPQDDGEEDMTSVFFYIMNLIQGVEETKENEPVVKSDERKCH